MLEAGNTQVNQRIMPEDFEGTFDGNGHTISGIYMPSTDGNYIGMLKPSHGTIKNLGVLDSYFGGSGSINVGTFAGQNNCWYGRTTPNVRPYHNCGTLVTSRYGTTVTQEYSVVTKKQLAIDSKNNCRR